MRLARLAVFTVALTAGLALPLQAAGPAFHPQKGSEIFWDKYGIPHLYAKSTPDLLQFITQFKEHHGVPLEPIYTGKMMSGIFDLTKQGFFKTGSTLLAIHTGGLQGKY